VGPRFHLPQQAAELSANEAVHFRDIGRRRRQPRAYRPHRLVGDHGVRGACLLRQRSLQLAPDDLQGRPVAPLLLGLADADNGGQAGTKGGSGLGVYERVGLAVIGAALRMTDDHGRGARVGKHLG